MLKISFDTTRFKADLKAFEEKVSSSLELTTKEAAEAIKTDAKYLDSDRPEIANSIDVKKNDGKGWQILKGHTLERPELAAYSEFGTGPYAASYLGDKPDWLRAMAWYYKRPKDGHTPAKPSLYTAFVKNTTNIADEAAKKIG